uniref:Uncharacterized protein n=3 Tax=viral metagenome TaxID=1070528 RepID=A0A6M3JEV1_9ZZZZ
MMALKNYTSQVSASRSISLIEDKLAHHGARQILKEYTADGRVACIAFIMHINGIELPFHLPARIEACEKVLKAKVRRPNKATYKRIHDQAERTAWKILADWVDAQMAMIELAQVDVLEVFLPYLFDRAKRQTFYQALQTQGFQKALPAFCSVTESKGGD